LAFRLGQVVVVEGLDQAGGHCDRDPLRCWEPNVVLDFPGRQFHEGLLLVEKGRLLDLDSQGFLGEGDDLRVDVVLPVVELEGTGFGLQTGLDRRVVVE